MAKMCMCIYQILGFVTFEGEGQNSEFSPYLISKRAPGSMKLPNFYFFLFNVHGAVGENEEGEGDEDGEDEVGDDEEEEADDE